MQQNDVPQGYRCLTEGQARILYIDSKMEVDTDNMITRKGKGKRVANEVNENRGAVFYNPVQEFNRDFSIMAINQFSEIFAAEKAAKKKEFKGLHLIEALAATGLRSVRYIKEIPSITKLVANDIDPTATDLMKKNFEFNSCPDEKIEGIPNQLIINFVVFTSDAIDLMHGMKKDKRYFDVVDLDPYGTAVPFLESALSCIGRDGMLCVTFTDMAVLCARKPHVCFYKYGAAPLGKSYCHEQALRMVLYTINTMANKHGKSIEPMVSLTVDFYVRLFIRVHDSLQSC